MKESLKEATESVDKNSQMQDDREDLFMGGLEGEMNDE
jgi:hypothetical protein